jgi:F-type H+-transporting ATPase subunit c
MDNFTSLTILASVSVFSAAITIGLAALGVSYGEGIIAREAVLAIAKQPDEVGNINKTLFISMAMVESSSIYCLVVSMILIFANPFWNALIQKF